MTSERVARPPRRSRRKSTPDFYERALNEAEQAAMESARDIEGLDEEIAMLRVKLLSSLGAEKFDMNQMLRGMELLIRAVSARYKVSGKNEDDLYASAVGVLKGMGELLTPPVDEHG